MTEKFTPGPWSVSAVRLTIAPPIGRDTRLLTVGPDNDRLAIVFFDMKTGCGHADARLIAAAPDLLEAVLHVRSIIIEGAATGFNPLSGNWAENLFASQALTYAAVKKSGGQVMTRTAEEVATALESAAMGEQNG